MSLEFLTSQAKAQPFLNPRFKSLVLDSGLQLSSGATNGYVLTSDSKGAATWQVASGGGAVTSVTPGDSSIQTVPPGGTGAVTVTASGTFGSKNIITTGHMECGQISSDGGAVSSDGSGDFSASTIAANSSFSSDSGIISSDGSGNLTALSFLASSGRQAVTQTGDSTTTVVCNGSSGIITTVNNISAGRVTFSVTNSYYTSASQVIQLTIQYGVGSPSSCWPMITAANAGSNSFFISLFNDATGNPAELTGSYLVHFSIM